MMKQIFGKVSRKQSKEAGNSANGLTSSTISKSSVGENRKLGNSVNAVISTKHSVASIDCKNRGLQEGNLEAKGILPTASYETLPGFRDVPNSEKQSLFLRKLKMCCVLFDFSDPTKNLKEKEVKRQTLLELVEYVNSANVKFTENVMQEAVRMVSVNLFRSFSPQPREIIILEAFDLEEEEPAMDPAWSHLQIVYEFLLRLIVSPETNAKVAKRYLDHSFVLKLLDLFDSEDPREREYLKTILHRIYGKFMVHRPFIRKAINNIFYHFVFETEKHSGISELLEILGSIINGFALPLKEEHKLFLVRALIPLHKPRCLGMYHQQLSYCITQFIVKESKLTEIVIRGLLKYWPVTNSSKEVMFLNELEEVLEMTQPAEFQRCMVPLFHQIARCLTSLHFQVAERTLFLWNNDHIGSLIKQNCKVIVPIIFPALERNARDHWNQAVRELAVNVHKIFYDLDPELFKKCLDKFEEDESNKDEVRRKHEARWKLLEDLAAEKAASNEAVLVPQAGFPRPTAAKRSGRQAIVKPDYEPCSRGELPGKIQNIVECNVRWTANSEDKPDVLVNPKVLGSLQGILADVEEDQNNAQGTQNYYSRIISRRKNTVSSGGMPQSLWT